MSILFSKRLPGGFTLEVVDGKDIYKTYNALFLVKSCMTRSKKTKFYSELPVSLIRITRRKFWLFGARIVYLRALVWEAEDVTTGETVRLLDRIYTVSEYASQMKQFLREECQKKPHGYDIKDSARRLCVRVNNSYTSPNQVPYMDTFTYANRYLTKIYNHLAPDAYYTLNSL